MKNPKRVVNYIKENLNEVKHTTLNPEGPGVVRIHMVPPKYDGPEPVESVVILNGQDIIPINVSWAVLLSMLIDAINEYHGRPITEEDTQKIIESTLIASRKVYRFIPKSIIKKDIYRIMNTFKQIAYGEKPDETIEYINIGEYADNMRAPHRMDLMVSAMTREGRWHCNQNCIHCYAAGQDQAGEEELSTEDWKKILDKCRKICVPQVTFTGGEPTMREDLIELIDHARWFVTRLNTNGIKLTKEYCKQLFEASLDSVQITFYSHDAAVHNELVGAQMYDRTLDGIKNALEAGLNLSINTPLCTKNKDYVKTLQFLHDLGVTYVTCSGLIMTGNAALSESEDLQLSKEEIRSVLKEAVDYAYANGMEISFTSPGWIDEEFFEENGLNTPTCGACLSNMAITPGGFAVPCQSWLTDGNLGNFLDEDWEKIWYSGKCQNRRYYSGMMTGLCPLAKSLIDEDDSAGQATSGSVAGRKGDQDEK
ncbi:MAG: radical SAM protein [Lachnospiraceae bacterium]|nr:radical SAM protein [Lachnospiraceae bacterium]